ncbi:uncharacterized protein LOC127000226 [Eriocheir sinensis]|uniref:uncharacterized protein LOC127000226 n=1 Tax=Eriocheir sinensis TaxID=95602 RepID=UPI0021C74B0F|nr:uncharacterized protein LOC127000226 [Eriocheir sinensis]
MCWWSPRAGGDVMREIGDSGRCNGGPAAPREPGGGVGGGSGDGGGGQQLGGEDPEETTPLTLLSANPPDKDLTDINSLLDDIHKLGGRGDSIPLRSLTPGLDRDPPSRRHTPVSQPRASHSRKPSSSSSEEIIEVEPRAAAQVRPYHVYTMHFLKYSLPFSSPPYPTFPLTQPVVISASDQRVSGA